VAKKTKPKKKVVLPIDDRAEKNFLETLNKVNISLFEALQPLLDKLAEEEDDLSLAMMGPLLVSVGVSILLDTAGEEDTMEFLENTADMIESGEFESLFDIEDESGV